MLINNRLKLCVWQYWAFKGNNTKDAFVSNPTWICDTECYGVKNQVQSILTAGFAHLMVNYFFSQLFMWLVKKALEYIQRQK